MRARLLLVSVLAGGLAAAAVVADRSRTEREELRLVPVAHSSTLAPCDADGVATSYQVSYAAGPPAGYRVSGVVLSGIASGCFGKAATLKLRHGTTTLAAPPPALIGASSLTVPLTPPPLAREVTSVYVLIAIEGVFIPPECESLELDLDIGFVGSPERDNVQGTAQGDLMLGLGDRDTLHGKDDRDCLDGGAGDDDLRGFKHADILVGGAGADTLAGGDAASDPSSDLDLLEGGAGNDSLDGGPGNDVLRGGADGDQLKGGLGDDQLDGGPGTDTCEGGPGADTFVACEVVKQ